MNAPTPPTAWPLTNTSGARVRVAVLLVLIGLLVGACEQTNDQEATLAEMAYWETQIELPSTSSYSTLTLTPPFGRYEKGYGRIVVEDYAICAWSSRWLDALADGDGDAVAQSLRAIEQLVPTSHVYETADASGRDFLDSHIEAMRTGVPETISRYLDLNCPTPEDPSS